MKNIGFVGAVWVLSAVAVVAQQSGGLVIPDAAPVNLAKSTLVQQFPQGSFLEDVVIDKQGNIYVGEIQFANSQGGVYRLTVQGQLEKLTTEPVSTLALDADGGLYGNRSIGNPAQPESVQRQFVRVNTDGSVVPIVTYPKLSQPNNVSFDTGGLAYSTDSNLGQIYRINPKTSSLEVWSVQPMFKSDMSGIPGINGIRVYRNSVYVVNSSTGVLWRVPVLSGGRAGVPVRIAGGVTGDGFDVDSRGNFYVTTHLFNSLIRVSPSGVKEVVGNAKNSIIGPSSAAFGVYNGKSQLFVVGEGGTYAKLLPTDFLKIFPETTQKDFSQPFIAVLDIKR